jgi:putative flippase GtrA
MTLLAKKSIHHLLLAPVENTFLQLPRALVTSGLAATLDMVVLVLLVQAFGWHPLIAATVSYLLGGVVQYTLSAVWVFPGAPRNATVGFISFTVLSLVGLFITWVTMWCLDLVHVNYAAAKVLALGLAFFWNFLSRKYFLFKSSNSDRGAETCHLTQQDECPETVTVGHVSFPERIRSERSSSCDRLVPS